MKQRQRRRRQWWSK